MADSKSRVMPTENLKGDPPMSTPPTTLQSVAPTTHAPSEKMTNAQSDQKVNEPSGLPKYLDTLDFPDTKGMTADEIKQAMLEWTYSEPFINLWKEILPELDNPEIEDKIRMTEEQVAELMAMEEQDLDDLLDLIILGREMEIMLQELNDRQSQKLNRQLQYGREETIIDDNNAENEQHISEESAGANSEDDYEYESEIEFNQFEKEQREQSIDEIWGQNQPTGEAKKSSKSKMTDDLHATQEVGGLPPRKNWEVVESIEQQNPTEEESTSQELTQQQMNEGPTEDLNEDLSEDPIEDSIEEPINYTLSTGRPRPPENVQEMRWKTPGVPIAIKKNRLYENLHITKADEEMIPVVEKKGKNKFKYQIGRQTRTTTVLDPILTALKMALNKKQTTQTTAAIIFQYSNICMMHASGCCLLGFECQYSHLPAHHDILGAYADERRRQGFADKPQKYAKLAAKFQSQVNCIATEVAGTECKNLHYLLTNKKMQAKDQASKSRIQRRAQLLRQYILGHLLLEDANERKLLKRELMALFKNDIAGPTQIRGKFTLTKSITFTMEDTMNWLTANAFMELNGKTLWDLDRNAGYSDAVLYKKEWVVPEETLQQMKQWQIKDADNPWLVTARIMQRQEHVRLLSEEQEMEDQQEIVKTLWRKLHRDKWQADPFAETLVPRYNSHVAKEAWTFLQAVKETRPWIKSVKLNEHMLAGSPNMEETEIRGKIREARRYAQIITSKQEKKLYKKNKAEEMIAKMLGEEPMQDSDKNFLHKTPNSQLSDVGNKQQIKKSGNQEKLQEQQPPLKSKATSQATEEKVKNKSRANAEATTAKEKSQISTDSQPFKKTKAKKVQWESPITKEQIIDDCDDDVRWEVTKNRKAIRQERKWMQDQCRKYEKQSSFNQVKGQKLCRFQFHADGCHRGSQCKFKHVPEGKYMQVSDDDAGQQHQPSHSANAPEPLCKQKTTTGPPPAFTGGSVGRTGARAPNNEVLIWSQVVPQTTKQTSFVKSSLTTLGQSRDAKLYKAQQQHANREKQQESRADDGSQRHRSRRGTKRDETDIWRKPTRRQPRTA